MAKNTTGINRRNVILVIDGYKDLENTYKAWAKKILPRHTIIFVSSVNEMTEKVRDLASKIALVISGAIIHNEGKSWDCIAASTMEVMENEGVNTPFLLVSGMDAQHLPQLPKPPTAIFLKGKDTMGKIFLKVCEELQVKAAREIPYL